MDEPGFAGAVLTLTVTLTSALDCDRALWSNTEERREKVNGINGPYDRYRRIWSRVRRTSAPPGTIKYVFEIKIVRLPVAPYPNLDPNLIVLSGRSGGGALCRPCAFSRP